MVSQLRRTLVDSFSSIEAAFLEFAAPDVQNALQTLINNGAKQIYIYPYFLNSGKHVHNDIPTIIQETKNNNPETILELLPHFGSSPHILSVITNDLKDL